MYRECFLYSQEKISSNSKSNMIYLHSNDSKIYVSKQIPYFAYFKIPIHYQHQWIFYANDIQITVKINDLISVPFYKLQNLLDNSKKRDQETSILNKEISRAFNKSLDTWFHKDDKSFDDDDIIIFFKIISTNFSFNRFSSMYNKMHPIISKNESDLNDLENQIEVNFKKFLLSVRPNGKPNFQPLFEFSTSFLMFFHQLKYSAFYITHQKFVSYGIHYILDYLHNDNEWGPYAILSFISRQLETNQIKSNPLNNYIIEQNPEFYFDKKNLSCVTECASIFGKISLVWCYNPSFHNDFVKIAKNTFGKRGKKIIKKDLFDIILSRIYNENENEFSSASVNDYSSFFKFIQIISPETNNIQIFSDIYNIIFSNSSDKAKLLPYKFKIFYENEIKCEMLKHPQKLHWLYLLEEQKQLNQNLINSNIDDYDDDAENNNSFCIKNEDNDFESNNTNISGFIDHGYSWLGDNQNKISIDTTSIYANKSLNCHHIILASSLPNNDIDKLKLSDDNQSLENFDEWPHMKERFGKVEVKLIKKPENILNSYNMPFNFTQSSTMNLTLGNDQNESKNRTKSSNNSILSEVHDHKKKQNESKQPQVPINNREKSFSII